MERWKQRLWQEDIRTAGELPLPWEKLTGRSILVAGASGAIGTCLIDVLMYRNTVHEDGIRIYALGRDRKRAEERFAPFWNHPYFLFVEADLCKEGCPLQKKSDYVIHAASNTHPLQYVTDPVGTILTNTMGTAALLNYASAVGAARFLFVSSVEIYGENRGDIPRFSEDSCGYLDCNTLRAGYPESKRTGEALCQAYRKTERIDAVIARLPRVFGPSMRMEDSKAIAQFIKKGIAGEPVVLKSSGTQRYSYVYVADAVSGLLTVLLKGADGEAYNIADEKSEITLRQLAESIAAYKGTEVVFELPEKEEAAGYSRAQNACLDGSRLRNLGWKPGWELQEALKRTTQILEECIPYAEKSRM